jgi:multidrug efflux pump subunit AcrA (membrane-fusion protein)
MLTRLYACLPMLLVGGLSLAWASRPSVPVLVHGTGLMTAPDLRRPFYARGPGQVQDIKAVVGQQVRRGELLLSLSQVGQAAPGAGADAVPDPRVSQARLAAIAAELEVLQRQAAALDDQRRALADRRRQIQTTNRPVASQLQALEALRREDVVARFSPLWVGAQDLYLRNQADISAVDARLAELRSQEAALAARRSQLGAERAGLLAEELSQQVFSPADGRLLDVSVQRDQAVLAGQRLGSIALPAQGPGRRVVVLFTTADASRLRPGAEVMVTPQLLSRSSYGDAGERYGKVPGRLLSLSSESVTLNDVAAQLGSQEEAANLMASARQESFGEGGDLTAQLPGRSGAPLVMGVVELEQARSRSGLAWSRGDGPPHPLPNRTPASVETEVEQRSPLGYALPFWRWLIGARES